MTTGGQTTTNTTCPRRKVPASSRPGEVTRSRRRLRREAGRQLRASSVPDPAPSGQWPVRPPDPDAYDEATRPVSPDIVASVLNPTPASPAQPPPPPQWPQPARGLRPAPVTGHSATAGGGACAAPPLRRLCPAAGLSRGRLPPGRPPRRRRRRRPMVGWKAGRRDTGQFPDPDQRAAHGRARAGTVLVGRAAQPRGARPAPETAADAGLAPSCPENDWRTDQPGFVDG